MGGAAFAGAKCLAAPLAGFRAEVDAGTLAVAALTAWEACCCLVCDVRMWVEVTEPVGSSAGAVAAAAAAAPAGAAEGHAAVLGGPAAACVGGGDAAGRARCEGRRELLAARSGCCCSCCCCSGGNSLEGGGCSAGRVGLGPGGEGRTERELAGRAGVARLLVPEEDDGDTGGCVQSLEREEEGELDRKGGERRREGGEGSRGKPQYHNSRISRFFSAVIAPLPPSLPLYPPPHQRCSRRAAIAASLQRPPALLLLALLVCARTEPLPLSLLRCRHSVVHAEVLSRRCAVDPFSSRQPCGAARSASALPSESHCCRNRAVRKQHLGGAMQREQWLLPPRREEGEGEWEAP